MTALQLPANRSDAGAAPSAPAALAERRLPPELAEDGEARRRFLQTAQMLRRLRHPHIATVVAVDEDGDQPAYQVEVIAGIPLAAEAQAAGGFSVERTIALLRPVCAALDALHDEGLLCRELARDALLEPGGRLRLQEWGITPPQPGETAGVEEDIRALGAFAWTLLSGASAESMASHGRWRTLPAAARAALGMALAADPAARPPSASAFLALFDGSWPLTEAAQPRPETAIPAQPPPRQAASAPTGSAAATSPAPSAAGADASGPHAEKLTVAPPAVPSLTASEPDATALRPRRRFEGWRTNAVAALLWVATFAAAGGAIAHYAGSRGGPQAGPGGTASTPAAQAGFPAVPGASQTAPGPLCPGAAGATPC